MRGGGNRLYLCNVVIEAAVNSHAWSHGYFTDYNPLIFTHLKCRMSLPIHATIRQQSKTGPERVLAISYTYLHRHTHRVSESERERERGRGGGGGQTERQTDRENSNSKTLFYKDCSLGSVKNCLTTSPC